MEQSLNWIKRMGYGPGVVIVMVGWCQCETQRGQAEGNT